MTDSVIQHTSSDIGLMACSTADGQEVAVELEGERISLSYQAAEDWLMSFTLLALTPEIIPVLLANVPPQFEGFRPFLEVCEKSPGTAANFAILFRYALMDAKALRQGGPSEANPFVGLLP